MSLLVKGNSKLGEHVYHLDLPAGPPERGGACPVTSEVCRSFCYAQKGMYVFQRGLYGRRLALWLDDPGGFEAELRMEVAALPPSALFRWHTSGDLVDAGYARMVGRVIQARPDIQHWLYTRTWATEDQELRAALAELRTLPNARVWFSTDDTMPDPRSLGWDDVLEARIFANELDARFAGFAICPEQTGRQPDCESCRLCPGIRPGRGFRLAFILHG